MKVKEANPSVKFRVLKCLNKPRITREIQKLAKISKRWDTREALKELEFLGYVTCINNTIKRARLYAITEKGLEFLKGVEGEEKFKSYFYDTLSESRDIDWDSYAWVIDSNRRKDMLKAIKKDYPKTTKQIRVDSRDIENRLTSIEVGEILRDFLGKGIVQVIKKKHKRRLFTITEKGERILGMLLK